jgi:hypothetical protein
LPRAQEIKSFCFFFFRKRRVLLFPDPVPVNLQGGAGFAELRNLGWSGSGA